MAYAEEKWAFNEFKAALISDARLRNEYEQAIESVVREYNTSIFENRFITGGAVELFTMWTMRSIGIDASKVGAQLRGADIQLPRGGRLSIKSSFTSPPGAIRLINVQGQSKGARWTDATIFVLAEIGVGYADPDILPGATRSTGDAIQLPWPRLSSHLKNRPEFLVEVQIPTKSRLTAQSKVASEAVARDVVDALDLRRLKAGML